MGRHSPRSVAGGRDDKKLSQGRIRRYRAGKWGIILIDVVNEDVGTTNQLLPGSDVMFQTPDNAGLVEGDVVVFDVRKRPNSDIYQAVNVTKLEGLDVQLVTLAKMSKMETLAENKLSLGFSSDIIDLTVPTSPTDSPKRSYAMARLSATGRLARTRSLTLKPTSMAATASVSSMGRYSGVRTNREFFQQAPQRPTSTDGFAANLQQQPNFKFDNERYYENAVAGVASMPITQRPQFDRPSLDAMSMPADMGNLPPRGTLKGGRSSQKVKILLQKPPFMERFDLTEIANNLINNTAIQQQHGLRYTTANSSSESAQLGKQMAYLLLQAKEELDREDTNDQQQQQQQQLNQQLMGWNNVAMIPPSNVSFTTMMMNDGTPIAIAPITVSMAPGQAPQLSIQQAMNHAQAQLAPATPNAVQQPGSHIRSLCSPTGAQFNWPKMERADGRRSDAVSSQNAAMLPQLMSMNIAMPTMNLMSAGQTAMNPNAPVYSRLTTPHDWQPPQVFLDGGGAWFEQPGGSIDAQEIDGQMNTFDPPMVYYHGHNSNSDWS